MFQDTLFDLDSLKDFPPLTQTRIRIDEKVNIGRNLSKSSWRNIDWQHLFRVCIIAFPYQNGKYVNSLGYVSSYKIKEEPIFFY